MEEQLKRRFSVPSVRAKVFFTFQIYIMFLFIKTFAKTHTQKGPHKNSPCALQQACGFYRSYCSFILVSQVFVKFCTVFYIGKGNLFFKF